MGRDGIYEFNQYLPYPERPKWIHAASGYMYGNLETPVFVRTMLPITTRFLTRCGSASSALVERFQTTRLSLTSPMMPSAPTTLTTASRRFAHTMRIFAQTSTSGFWINCICSQSELNDLDSDGSLQLPKKEGELHSFSCRHMHAGPNNAALDKRDDGSGWPHH